MSPGTSSCQFINNAPCPMLHIFGEDEDAVEAPGLMRAAKQAIRGHGGL